ncbi:hypothetical protein THRCLA_23047 [Thraustotheca clavata]|uniref:Secreted protein n=1 Tax=Thraustotheca clavata TaxID=74557 RepID=A0A1V9YHN7_9STRA|nr:hypothetical protein THRCLA_23047 [Thraustotheca clavata]
MRLLMAIAMSAAALECDPSMDAAGPSNVQEGQPCGGWCGTLGSCASGLHCDEGLVPLPLMPFGMPIASVCRNTTKDDALWSKVNVSECSTGWQMLSLTNTDDLNEMIAMTSNAVVDIPTLQFDPCVRILTGKVCAPELYVILLERMYQDPKSLHYYLVQGNANSSALPTVKDILIHT